MTSKFQQASSHHYGMPPQIIQKINFHTIKDMDIGYDKQFKFVEEESQHIVNETKQTEETFEIHNAYEVNHNEEVHIHLNELVKQKPIPFVNANIFLKKNTKSIF